MPTALFLKDTFGLASVENICTQKRLFLTVRYPLQSEHGSVTYCIITNRTSSRASILGRVSIKRLLCERDGKQQQMYCLFKSSKLPANDHH